MSLIKLGILSPQIVWGSAGEKGMDIDKVISGVPQDANRV